MVILGIDPGYAIVGYGIIDYSGNNFKPIEYGAVTTPAGMPFSKRLVNIFNSVTEIIKRTKPEAMSIEKLFFNTNTTTARDVHRHAVLFCLQPSSANFRFLNTLRYR